MKKISLTQGLFTLVDDDDFEMLSKYKWYADKVSNVIYAATHRPYLKRDGTIGSQTVRMHRVIFGLNRGDSRVVDHKNLNGLDNRKNNLRLCSRAENSRNQRRRKDNTSGFTGVSFHAQTKKWVAQLVVNKKYKNLGLYNTKSAAVAARRKAEIEYFKDFRYIGK